MTSSLPLSVAILEKHNDSTLDSAALPPQLQQQTPAGGSGVTSGMPSMKRLSSTISQASLSQVQENPETAACRSGNGGQKGLAGLMMMKRKVKTWKKGGGSVMGSSIRSGPKLQLENTYQLQPSEKERFNEDKIKIAINDSIKLFTAKQTEYNHTKSAQISKYLSEDIKTRVKQLNYKRYKFAVHVMVGENREQGLKYATQCVWDTNTDSEATVVYQHKDVFIVANVFGVYFD